MVAVQDQPEPWPRRRLVIASLWWAVPPFLALLVGQRYLVALPRLLFGNPLHLYPDSNLTYYDATTILLLFGCVFISSGGLISGLRLVRTIGYQRGATWGLIRGGYFLACIGILMAPPRVATRARKVMDQHIARALDPLSPGLTRQHAQQAVEAANRQIRRGTGTPHVFVRRFLRCGSKPAAVLSAEKLRKCHRRGLPPEAGVPGKIWYGRRIPIATDYQQGELLGLEFDGQAGLQSAILLRIAFVDGRRISCEVRWERPPQKNRRYPAPCGQDLADDLDSNDD